MRKGRRPRDAGEETGADDIAPEYDFSRARPNKYASKYQKGGLVITLDPDVATVFVNATEANEALRSLARLLRTQQRRRSKGEKSTTTASSRRGSRAVDL